MFTSPRSSSLNRTIRGKSENRQRRWRRGLRVVKGTRENSKVWDKDRKNPEDCIMVRTGNARGWLEYFYNRCVTFVQSLRSCKLKQKLNCPPSFTIYVLEENVNTEKKIKSHNLWHLHGILSRLTSRTVDETTVKGGFSPVVSSPCCFSYTLGQQLEWGKFCRRLELRAARLSSGSPRSLPFCAQAVSMHWAIIPSSCPKPILVQVNDPRQLLITTLAKK